MLRRRRFIRILLIAAGLPAMLFLLWLFLPKGPRDPMEWKDPIHVPRPTLEAREFAVVAGTPWASRAAEDILRRGGNAFDAAVAGVLMLNATFGEAASFPGVAPMMIYDAETGEYRSYIGAGTAPAAATIDLFAESKDDVVPDFDIRSQLLPASPDVLLTLLAEYGTMSFAEAAAPAISIARGGFPVHSIMKKNLDFSLVERIGFSIIMPTTAEYYLRGEWWRPIHYKDRFSRPELADTWEKMAGVERAALDGGESREGAIAEVRDYFYKGEIAEAIVEFHRKEGGLFTSGDLAEYAGGWEAPYSADVGDYRIHTNRGWSQGIVVPLVLGILEEVDLGSLGHNSPRYVHTVLQAIDLAMADREAYVADPDFFDVPDDVLLSPEYWARRRAVLSDRAFGEMPPAGVIPGYDAARGRTGEVSPDGPFLSRGPSKAILGDFFVGRDTSQIVVVDGEGNAAAVTPSDFPKSPMLPEWGLNLGNRMVQFRLDPDHPASLEPGKRPRITPHAVIVEHRDEPFLVFNTPGGDMQTQALVQVFLNLTRFGMDVQEAVDAPRFRSYNFPDSFSPHTYRPGKIALESELYESCGETLEALGYAVKDGGSWNNDFSAVGAILYDGSGLRAGSDPREATTAAGR